MACDAAAFKSTTTTTTTLHVSAKTTYTATTSIYQTCMLCIDKVLNGTITTTTTIYHTPTTTTCPATTTYPDSNATTTQVPSDVLEKATEAITTTAEDTPSITKLSHATKIRRPGNA